MQKHVEAGKFVAVKKCNISQMIDCKDIPNMILQLISLYRVEQTNIELCTYLLYFNHPMPVKLFTFLLETILNLNIRPCLKSVEFHAELSN